MLQTVATLDLEFRPWVLTGSASLDHGLGAQWSVVASLDLRPKLSGQWSPVKNLRPTVQTVPVATGTYMAQNWRENQHFVVRLAAKTSWTTMTGLE